MRSAPLLGALRNSLLRLTEGRLVPLSILAGVVASAGIGVGMAQAQGDPPDILPLSEVKPGMKGYGLTVFQGTSPEKFDIEVISTLHHFRPNQDLILIKTPHPRLNITRTVAGMSGSPIYLNGKMIGAYAYGWLFGTEAVAGVTPIKSMIDELNRPLPRAIAPGGQSPIATGPGNVGAAPGGKSSRHFLGALDTYQLGAHAKQLASRAESVLSAPEGTGLARASTPIMMGGLGATSMKIASDLLSPMGLDPVQGGGSGGVADPSAPTRFVDGGAIGVELIRGDVSAMGIGTVTRVSGDKLVAFGHPMLGGGIEALPTAIGRVHWIMSTTNRSFKIGEAARSLGTLVNDRQAAIVVDQAQKAPTFPVHLEIKGVTGVPKTLWNSEVAHDQFMAPSFLAMALGSAVEEVTAERRDMTWRAKSTIHVKGHGSATVYDFGSGNGNPVGAEEFVRSRVARSVGQVLNNPWQPAVVESVDTTVSVTFDREVLILRGVKVLEPEIDVGHPVRIRLDLEPYQGKQEYRIIEVKIPPELAGREVDIDLSPGYTVERPLPTPDSVAELMANLNHQTFEPDSIVATFRIRETGAAFRGKLASRLPPAAVDLIRPANQSDSPELFGSYVQVQVPLKRFLVGSDSVHVTVKPVLK